MKPAAPKVLFVQPVGPGRPCTFCHLTATGVLCICAYILGGWLLFLFRGTGLLPLTATGFLHLRSGWLRVSVQRARGMVGLPCLVCH